MLERLPEHPGYNTKLNSAQRINLRLGESLFHLWSFSKLNPILQNGQEILDNLAELKPGIVDRYEKWHQSHPDGVLPIPLYMTRPQQLQQPPTHSSDHHPQCSPPRAAPYSSFPPPDLDQLAQMGADSIGSLSIGALKSILFTNHVSTGLILEKGDLVEKVLVLDENEKAERVRQRQMEEREEMERLQRAVETMHGADHHMEEETERGQSGESGQHVDESDFDIPLHQSDGERRNDHDETSHFHSASPPHPKSSFERLGMCVICQDEDANIAIIDCG